MLQLQRQLLEARVCKEPERWARRKPELGDSALSQQQRWRMTGVDNPRLTRDILDLHDKRGDKVLAPELLAESLIGSDSLLADSMPPPAQRFYWRSLRARSGVLLVGRGLSRQSQKS